MTNPPPDGWQPSGNPKADAKAAKAYAKAQRPWFKKKRFIIPLALIALLIIINLASGNDENTSDTVSSETSESTPTPEKTDAKKEEGKEEKKEAKDSGPKLTNQQQNAVRTAENYLSVMAFSRNGLIEQLSSEHGDGYDKKDATIAVDSLNVDWNEQAVKSAKNYLDLSGFSCSGLIEQLSSSHGEGFTKEQAKHGAEKAGAC